MSQPPPHRLAGVSLAAVALGLLCLFTLGCASRQPTRPLTFGDPYGPDVVILYAVDGPVMEGAGFDLGLGNGPYDPLANYTADQLFHDYPILGSVDLTGTPQGSRLARHAEAARDRPQGLISGCIFTPRHALRVRRGGVTVDYVICFECEQLQWFVNDANEPMATQYFHQSYRNEFTIPLNQANIEIAP